VAGWHTSQALHKPLAEVIATGVDFCLSGPVSVICGPGCRLNIMGSLLKTSGCREVASAAGGMLAWTRSGHPVVKWTGARGEGSGAGQALVSWPAPFLYAFR